VVASLPSTPRNPWEIMYLPPVDSSWPCGSWRGTAARLAGLAGELVDYQPCYRSEAGTGNAMGFVTWA